MKNTQHDFATNEIPSTAKAAPLRVRTGVRSGYEEVAFTVVAAPPRRITRP